MDRALREAERDGDIVKVLQARVRMADDKRPQHDCGHCGRVVTRVDVACPGCAVQDSHRVGHWENGPCNGTGRTPWPWRGDTGRLALAAYAGDEAARALLGYRMLPNGRVVMPCVPSLPLDRTAWRDAEPRTFDGLLSGITHWPQAPLVAALAAGWAVLSKRRGTPGCALGRPHDGDCLECLVAYAVDDEAEAALNAAADHLACGCEQSRRAWQNLMADMPLWVPEPHPVAIGPDGRLDTRLGATTEAARQIGEPAVREAVTRGLRRWALDGIEPRGEA